MSPGRCSTLILETLDCGSPLVSSGEGGGREELGLVRGGGEIGKVKFVRGEGERGRKKRNQLGGGTQEGKRRFSTRRAQLKREGMERREWSRAVLCKTARPSFIWRLGEESGTLSVTLKLLGSREHPNHNVEQRRSRARQDKQPVYTQLQPENCLPTH